MRLEIFCVVCCMVLFVICSVEYANADQRDVECKLSISQIRNVPPIMYGDDNATRINPNGSLYPGDAFHFVFPYLKSHTCRSFNIEHVTAPYGATLSSVYVISNNTGIHAVDVVKSQWIPQNIKTTHYYLISRDCGTLSNPNCDAVLYASIPEGEELSYSQHKTMRKNNVLMNYTYHWDLILRETIQPNLNTHTFENEPSVDVLREFILQNCMEYTSDDGGCVFGHAELGTSFVDEVCLFTQLDAMAIKYDAIKETNLCVDLVKEREITAEISGKKHKCSAGRCSYYDVNVIGKFHFNIVSPFGDINYKYPILQDIDGFKSQNKDGTYYIHDAIAVHAIVDAPYKDYRAGTLRFDNIIHENALQLMSSVSCDDMCDVLIDGKKMLPYSHTIHNGDRISAMYSTGVLGLVGIPHNATLYNIDRYIGWYNSTATPLVVCYDPVISQIRTWSYLADAGHTSFDNRYAMAIKYDGSVGGCADDSDGMQIDRRVKITDFTSMSLNGGIILNFTISDANGIGEMSILDSVRSYISNDYSISDNFAGPVVAINHTTHDVQIDSAGFSRLLFHEYFNYTNSLRNVSNATVFNTLYSSFGGVSNMSLIHGTYTYPLGFFNTIFNVTSYKYLQVPCYDNPCDDVDSKAIADTDVIIGRISISDSDYENVSLADFYLNLHGDDEEFGYMHLADLYEMNINQDIQSHTAEFLLNQTSITYHDSYFASTSEIAQSWGEGFLDEFSSVRGYIIHQLPHIFHEGRSSIDMSISADRLGVAKTRSIPFEELVLVEPMYYSINMFTDNAIDITRANTAVSIPYHPKFGKISYVLIDGKPPENISCNKGCVVVLSDRLPVNIVAGNDWGGKIIHENLTSLDAVQYNPESSDLFQLRLFWMLVVLVMVYVVYRGLKMIFARRNGNAM